MKPNSPAPGISDHLLLEDGPLVGGIVMAAEFARGTVLQTRMGSHIIVMAPPDFDEDACFGAATKPFHVQARVPELAIEALVGTVLPRLAGIDEGGIDFGLGKPLQDRLADELRAVIRAQKCRCTVRTDQAREHVDDAGGADTARYVDGEALTGELVDDAESLELLPTGAGIVN